MANELNLDQITEENNTTTRKIQSENALLEGKTNKEQINLLNLMPNYRAFCDLYHHALFMVVAITFIVEWLTFGLLYAGNILKQPIPRYITLYIIIPTILNCLALLVASVMRKQYKRDIRMSNYIPVMTFLFYDIVIACAHNKFAVILCSFVIPISMTSVFGEKKMTKRVTLYSYIGLFIASAFKIAVSETVVDMVWCIPEIVIACAALAVTYVIVKLVLGVTGEQMDKLLGMTVEARKAQRMEAVANNAKSAFLANMSHEIRTPINAIIGMNEMVLRDSEDDKVLEYSGNIKSASEYLLSLVNDVLDISKIESGKMEIVSAYYDTAELLKNCCNMMTERVERKGLNFMMKCDENLPKRLKGDEARIRQIIINILSNSEKYTEKGGVIFSVSSEKRGDTFYLVVSVKDTGIGMKQSDMRQLFQPFQRFELKRNRNIQGTGLGLAITRQLLELMGGEITVQSTYGEGSEFVIRIPQEVADDTPIGNIQQDSSGAKRKKAALRQIFEAPDAKVLIVDDVQMNLKVASSLLKRTKMQIDTALSGPECIRKCQQTKYDIILMDHMMPEMDGIETVQKVKSDASGYNNETPIIMLTANAMIGAEKEYQKCGCVDCLLKPVQGLDLEQMLLKYLDKDKMNIMETWAKEQK